MRVLYDFQSIFNGHLPFTVRSKENVRSAFDTHSNDTIEHSLFEKHSARLTLDLNLPGVRQRKNSCAPPITSHSHLVFFYIRIRKSQCEVNEEEEDEGKNRLKADEADEVAKT